MDKWDDYLKQITEISDEIVAANEKKMCDIDVWFEDMQNFKQIFGKTLRDFELKKSQLQIENEELKKKCAKFSEVVKGNEDKVTILKETLDSQLSELALLKKEYNAQVELRESNKRKSELTETDRRILAESKLKLDLYRELTGVKFDFTLKESEGARGFVRSQSTGRCSTFDLRSSSLGPEQLEEHLWSLIEPGTGPGDRENKENTSDNQ